MTANQPDTMDELKKETPSAGARPLLHESVKVLLGRVLRPGFLPQ